MHIIHVASEIAPIAKVGGLADVVYGLCKELVRKNHEIEIILPKYDCIDLSHVQNLQIEKKELTPLTITWSLRYENLKIILLEPKEVNHFFNRETIYGLPDDIDRFLFFSNAVLEYLLHTKKKPDILHLHDWPTAFIAPLYKEKYKDLGVCIKGIVLTIHNMEHQGKCSSANLEKIVTNPKFYLTPDKLQDPFNPALFNLLKGGIEYADFITTVSPTYEKEAKTPEGGKGLDDRLRFHEKKFRGILNGIDTGYWNPEKDNKLTHHYSTDCPLSKRKFDKVLEGKKGNRKHLLSTLGMSESAAPLATAITRLVPQKAPELIRYSIERTLKNGGQYILLGSTNDPAIQNQFLELKKFYSNNKNVAILLNQNETVAHLIYAAADMFVIPSIFEPCGLTQMISMRYGTIPVVRLTGGLADTVFDIDTSTIAETKRNGFTFEYPDNKGIDWALDRAMECCSKNPQKWHKIMEQAMAIDFSWVSFAPKYVEIYEMLISKKARS